jgi:hypothetical protein
VPTILKLGDLRLDGGTQFRVELDPAHITHIADQLGRDDQARAVNPSARTFVPPVEVVNDNGVYWLACGFHRFWAHDEAGRDEIECVIHAGTLADAIKLALRSNTRHGLKLTDADKRKKVAYVLGHLDELGVDDNPSAVARFCLVSRDLVDAVKEERGGGTQPGIGVTGFSPSEDASAEEGQPEPPVVPYVTKHGTRATMRTSKIIAANRARKAEPEPKPETQSQPVARSRREELAQVAADGRERDHKRNETATLRSMAETVERLFKNSGEGVRFRLWERLWALMSDEQLDELAAHFAAWRSRRRRPNGQDRAPTPDNDLAAAPSRAQSH